MFIQASFAVDSPTARHLLWSVGHVKADLTNQFVRWCVHKIAVIFTSVGSIGSHLLQTVWTTYFYNYMIITLMFYWFLAVNLPMLCHSAVYTQELSSYVLTLALHVTLKWARLYFYRSRVSNDYVLHTDIHDHMLPLTMNLLMMAAN